MRHCATDIIEIKAATVHDMNVVGAQTIVNDGWTSNNVLKQKRVDMGHDIELQLNAEHEWWLNIPKQRTAVKCWTKVSDSGLLEASRMMVEHLNSRGTSTSRYGPRNRMVVEHRTTASDSGTLNYSPTTVECWTTVNGEAMSNDGGWQLNVEWCGQMMAELELNNGDWQ